MRKNPTVEFLRGARDLRMRDQIALARVRNRLICEAPHVQPGSLSYLALAWQWLIDELLESAALDEANG